MALGAGTFVFALAFAGAATDSARFDSCPDAGLEEGSGSSIDFSLWPPGTECTVTTMSGEVVSSSYVPWGEVAFAFLCAVIAWDVSRALLRRFGSR